MSRGYCVQSGPFLTLVRGARLLEERTDSALTSYVGTTFGQSILESKSGGKCPGVTVYYNKLSGPFLTLVRGSRLTEERTGSVQTRYVGTAYGYLLLKAKSGGNRSCDNSVQGLLHVYQKKLSGPFLTLVRGYRLTEERSGSAQTRYVGITCVWPLLEIKSGGNCSCLSSVQGLLCTIRTFLDSCPEGARLIEERTDSAQTRYVGTTFGQSILESKSGGNRIAVKIVSRGYCVLKEAVWTLLDSCPGVSSN